MWGLGFFFNVRGFWLRDLDSGFRVFGLRFKIFV